MGKPIKSPTRLKFDEGSCCTSCSPNLSQNFTQSPPVLGGVPRKLAKALEDPPESLPSFVVQQGGKWNCRKCKGRRFSTSQNHRLYYYDGQWRRRCAVCACKVRTQVNTGKRGRARQEELVIGSTSETREKDDIDMTEYSNVPHDRVYTLKTIQNEGLDTNAAVARYSHIEMNPADIRDSNAETGTYVHFYSMPESLETQLDDKVVYNVSPFITIRASMDGSSYKITGQTQRDEAAALLPPSAVSKIRLMLRWDNTSVELWNHGNRLVAMKIDASFQEDSRAPICYVVRSNIPSLRYELQETDFKEVPSVTNVEPYTDDEANEENKIVIVGQGFGKAPSRPSGNLSGHQLAAEALKQLSSPSSCSSTTQRSDCTVICGTSLGDETLEVYHRTPQKIICRSPRTPGGLAVRMHLPLSVPKLKVLDTDQTVAEKSQTGDTATGRPYKQLDSNSIWIQGSESIEPLTPVSEETKSLQSSECLISLEDSYHQQIDGCSSTNDSLSVAGKHLSPCCGNEEEVEQARCTLSLTLPFLSCRASGQLRLTNMESFTLNSKPHPHLENAEQFVGTSFCKEATIEAQPKNKPPWRPVELTTSLRCLGKLALLY
eukprot:gb/GECG01016839.1/.p1 GENE.gb/GECG01016839.1/~~gb/GECG01016839.1/.p1  ORF type:complete len:603 (+),score=58.76 gb/GECG01016839.1/:1-1809(+)